MTKAERIFEATRIDCLNFLRDWPEENGGGGLNRLTLGEDELFCQRTVNALRKILASKQRTLAIDRKLGVSTPERLALTEKTLRMVAATIDNAERALRWDD